MVSNPLRLTGVSTVLIASLCTTCHSFIPSSSPRSKPIYGLQASTKDQSDLDDRISDFCKGTNEFWKTLVIKPVRDYVEIQPAGSARNDTFSKLVAPPEIPGIPRPVWLTILGSVPTGLGWYGYYKFSVEEELYQYELTTETNGDGRVSGCGGYGTLFPFVYGILVGFPMQLLHVPGGGVIVEAAALWILLGQLNLYRRVNELCEEKRDEMGMSEPPLHPWWALLPPPLDVVVGLRQVHFLSEYWRLERGEEYDKDVIAEDLFPFISAPRFSLKEFFRTPSMWFWFTKDWKDLEIGFLKD
mmetsp:Transcript_27491/g.33343  ORF Transcript_27491/g.33343 Transcript_27491/m.33343 type:complete len:300 (+) Transcript_27491:67-966(+)|eukprot:CAMPEP_0172507318 /NCGR_PEP_ID=MMETSP1066-20121228/202773_1 /TAXON_ID=671091 /ORGANISM="Coscinodiscus wailesii, Strain CCMP2513" /LENGTH=299 /DNA_ID=CAMNT_0013284825 /DNA_START=61 /DNA_END=960 /DNA_ORIENTATION=-